MPGGDYDIYAWAYDLASNSYSEEPMVVHVVLSDSPADFAAELSFGLKFNTGTTNETGTKATADPTVTGTVTYAGDMADVVVEFDLNNDEVVDASVVPDDDGSFTFTPLGLATDQPAALAQIKARVRVPDFSVHAPDFQDTLISSQSNWYTTGFNGTAWVDSNSNDVPDVEESWFADGEQGGIFDNNGNFTGDWYNSAFDRDWTNFFADQTSEWQSPTENFSIALADDTDRQFHIDLQPTSGRPTIMGNVKLPNNMEGNVAGLTVEFYVNSATEPDGYAITGADGSFAYTIQSRTALLVAEDNQIEAKVLVPIYGSDQFTLYSSDDMGSDSIVHFQLNALVDGSVDSLSLKYGCLVHNGITDEDDLTAIDPTLVGQITMPGNPAGRIVQFDYDDDGLPDAEAITDGQGSFEFTPHSLDVDNGQTSVRAHVVEEFVDTDTDATYALFGLWRDALTWTVEENDPPVIQQFELLHDTGHLGLGYELLDRVTIDPTLAGRVSNDNPPAGVVVAFDYNGDNIIDAATTADANGYFQYTPQGLTAGAWNIGAFAGEAGTLLVGDVLPESTNWAHITKNGIPSTSSVFYGFTLVPATPLTSVVPDEQASPYYDPTITGHVNDDDTYNNLFVNFYEGETFLGSTVVLSDGTFSFTPIGLSFTSGAPHSIFAKVAKTSYLDGELPEVVSNAIDVSLSISSSITIDAPTLVVANSQLDPTVHGEVHPPYDDVNYGTSEPIRVYTMAVMYVEVLLDGTVTTVPVEAAPVDGSSGQLTFTYKFRPPWDEAVVNESIDVRPVGFADGAYYFGNWQSAMYSYDPGFPEIGPWTLRGDVGDLSSVESTIDGSVNAATTSGGVETQRPIVEFDYDHDGVADDSTDVDGVDGFTFTFKDLAPGANTVWARVARFETADTAEGEDQTVRIDGAWQELAFTLLDPAPQFDANGVELLSFTENQDGSLTTDTPSIQGVVVSDVGAAVSGMIVEVDFNLDGVADGTTVVAADGTFQYTARNRQPGPQTWQARPVDPFQSPSVAGEWQSISFVLTALAAPEIITFQLQNAETADGHGEFVADVCRHGLAASVLQQPHDRVRPQRRRRAGRLGRGRPGGLFFLFADEPADGCELDPRPRRGPGGERVCRRRVE